MLDQSAKYLTFNVNGDVYGSEIDYIQEIIEYGAITRVPLTPKYLRGVINLRGNVVPVIDLAIRLGKEASQVTKRTCIIIVEMKSIDDEVVDIGFVVDEVDEVLDIAADNIAAPPQFGSDIRTDFILGMGKLSGKFVVLLQLEEVLSIAELADLVELESKEN
ncbi:MAG: chemotaxis protein CheW [Gammaproteobacteria bacterium]|nr:chemotaxis protein CheW [Gammaproteobacteria bacterium]